MNRKQLKAEIIKCGVNPDYFIRNYIKIEHPRRGLIPFKLFDYQTELLESYREHRFNVILKARQLGISETSAAFAAWLMLFHRNKNIVVLATKKETAKNIIRKVRTGLKNLPSYMMISKIVQDNVYSIELSNGSRIKAVSTARDAGRSEAGSLLIIDEAAHIENMDEIWTGIRPVVTAGGSVIMLSTPKGVGNTFHKTYVGAETQENEFFPTKLMWWLHPEHIVDADGNCDLEDDPLRPGFKTSSWFRKETAGSDPRAIAQEHECNFNASGDTFIAPEYLAYIRDTTVLGPILLQGQDRKIHVWNEPLPYQQYLLVADVARGDGKDNSACHVLDIESMTQQAEYQGKLPPDQYADLLCRLGRQYNNALLVIENNSIGLACLEHVKLAEYENLYFSSKGDFRPGKIFNAALPLPPMSEYVPGFTTSPKTRPLMLQKLEEFVRHNQVTIRSGRLHQELEKFVWNSGRAEAMKGYNDDLVMAIAIACWLKETFLAPNMMSSDMNKRLLNMTSVERHDQTEVPGATKDPRFIRENERIARNVHQNPYEMALPDGTFENIGWLITSK